jgi:hypothetical protein
MKTDSATKLRLLDSADGVVEGPDLPPRVPDGQYQGVYVRHDSIEQRQFAGAPKVYLWVRLYDAGEHTGKMLYRSFRVRRLIGHRGFAVGRRSDLLKTYARLTEMPGHRPRTDRINLRDLRSMLLLVHTRTVVRDYRSRSLPEELRYSVVDEIFRAA